MFGPNQRFMLDLQNMTMKIRELLRSDDSHVPGISGQVEFIVLT